MEQLPVIFRAEKAGPFAGEITAVFPTIGETGGTVQIYAHVGQHGAGSLEWYRETRPATETESADLLGELTAIYTTRPAANPETYGEPVALVPVRRMTAAHRTARRES